MVAKKIEKLILYYYNKHNILTFEMDEKIVKKIWDKSTQVPDKDPNLYRQDISGNIMYFPSYGKESELSWMITCIDGRKGLDESNLCAISRQNKKVITKPIKKAQNKTKKK